MRSLSEYRWDKAYRRLKLRLRNAEKVFELVEDYDAMERLKGKAWRDYWDEVPELRGLKSSTLRR
jgi:hypothetical protein